MRNGWIKLHRSFLDWEWYTEPNVRTLFLHCLLMANSQDGRYRGTSIQRGSFLTSLELLSAQTGLSVRNVRTALKSLETTRELTRQATHLGTMVTICKYDVYQSHSVEGDTPSDTPGDKQVTSNRQAGDKQVTTNKNKENKENKENTLEKRAPIAPPPFPERERPGPEVLENWKSDRVQIPPCFTAFLGKKLGNVWKQSINVWRGHWSTLLATESQEELETIFKWAAVDYQASITAKWFIPDDWGKIFNAWQGRKKTAAELDAEWFAKQKGLQND